VHCSKGTYIRVLADNLAETWGRGTFGALTREASGPLSLDQALTPAQAEQLHAAGALAERLLGRMTSCATSRRHPER
jgi:tRNA U55 pseudouridine synthase TruB